MLKAWCGGTYAIGITSDESVAEFHRQGIGTNVKEVYELSDLLTTQELPIFLFDRAPHPNAAKVFLNWFLSKEGQTVWSRELVVNSRRRDVAPVNPNSALGPGEETKYLRTNQEDLLAKVTETQELLRNLLVR